MGSSCSVEGGEEEAGPPETPSKEPASGKAPAIHNELLVPLNPTFVLSRKWAAKAMLFVQSNLDEEKGTGLTPVVSGWKLCQSRQQKGRPVFENQFTKERIRWVPLESASPDAGNSPDILCMKAHFCFRQFEHFDALQFQLEDGNLRVRRIDSLGIIQSGWGPDGSIVLNCFLTMMNGRRVPTFGTMEDFVTWKKREWMEQCQFHALFAEKPGTIVARAEVTYLNFTDTAVTIAGSSSGAFSDDMF
jgi:hypothetical protein